MVKLVKNVSEKTEGSGTNTRTAILIYRATLVERAADLMELQNTLDNSSITASKSDNQQGSADSTQTDTT